MDALADVLYGDNRLFGWRAVPQGLAAEPMLEKLDRIKVKYGLVE